ncbi:hypothetical protein NC653_036718 [Populus alba x Populus x berolinensis]|uniref:Uncharacterized protein n=1 Tax=Populus alba x Populus x berolinensis TaxID=444605 RepID=A0AAD6LKS8_9ROSI|nr:hypothetical protein NC653_036718 [Populus alba x Populus x berolinensis]
MAVWKGCSTNTASSPLFQLSLFCRPLLFCFGLFPCFRVFLVLSLLFLEAVTPGILGAVAAEDGALKPLLLEATKTVVALVVTLVYCFPWSSFCASSAQDINDGDEDVRCCRLNGSLLPSVFRMLLRSLFCNSASSLVKSMGVLLLSGFLEAEDLLNMVKR